MNNRRYESRASRDEFRRFGKALAPLFRAKDWAAVYAAALVWPSGGYSWAEKLLPKDVFGLIRAANSKFGDAGQAPAWSGETWWENSAHSMLHVVHVSKDDPTKIAYAESLDKLAADRFTRTKPGRYLTKYFSDALSAADIKAWADRQVAENAPVEVKFARTEAECIRAVAKGPSSSCMAGDDWFKGQVHPAAIYATPDIEIAYFEVCGEIKARVICNAVKKLMARCYGDERRLLPAMEKLGYTQEVGALVGCRIRKIDNENGDGYIMAYVDAGTGSGGGNLNYVDLDSEYWKLVDSGGEATYAGYDNNGVTEPSDDEEDAVYCHDCGEACGTEDDDQRTYVDCTDEALCDHCLNERFVYAYGRRRGNRGTSQDYQPRDECIEVNAEWYVIDGLDSHDIYLCPITEEYYHLDDMVNTARGLIYSGEAEALDEPDPDGNDYAYDEDAVKVRGLWVYRDEGRLEPDDHLTQEEFDAKEAGDEVPYPKAGRGTFECEAQVPPPLEVPLPLEVCGPLHDAHVQEYYAHLAREALAEVALQWPFTATVTPRSPTPPVPDGLESRLAALAQAGQAAYLAASREEESLAQAA